MRHATFAPMATAPAVPPRTALADAFAMTSRKLKGCFFSPSPLILLLLVVAVVVISVTVKITDSTCMPQATEDFLIDDDNINDGE